MTGGRRNRLMLPNEILEKILLKLAIKLLISVRRVCKDWKSLIEHPEFAGRYHRTISNKYTILVAILSNEIYTLDINKIGTGEDYIIAKHAFQNVHGFSGFQLIGSCYNLLCFSTMKGTLLFYNPMTNSRWMVPVFRNKQPVFVVKKYVGFGYDSSSYDYKIVRIVWFSSQDYCGIDCEVNVYSLKSNSWKTMEYVKYKPESETSTHGVFVGNALHWMVSADFPNASTQLLSFDVGSEEFSLIRLPDSLENCCLNSMTLQALDGFLSLHAYKNDIWVMKIYGVEESWTRMFSIKTYSYYLKPVSFSDDQSKVLMSSDLKGGMTGLLFGPCFRFWWYDGNEKMNETIFTDYDGKTSIKVETCVVSNIFSK